MSIRTALVAPAAALAVLLPALLLVPAHADDQPFPLPPGVPTAGMPDAPKPSSGPTFVITPGSDGDHLGAPVKGPVHDPATKKPTPRATQPTKSPGAGATQVAGQSPTSVDAEEQRADDRWWAVGAGALLLIVLSEVFRLRARRS